MSEVTYFKTQLERQENEKQVVVLDRKKKARVQEAAHVYARSFKHDPVFTYFLSDFDARLEFLQALFSTVIPFNCGICVSVLDKTQQNLGNAYWVPPKAKVSAIDNMKIVWVGLKHLESISKRIELAKFFDYVGECHKEIMKDEPHWYLWMLGTDPIVQKQGIGSLALKGVLELADKNGTSCYLESSNPKNLSFYQKHGFEVVKEIYADPNNKVRVDVMVRKARQQL